jgi:hypothetical protein
MATTHPTPPAAFETRAVNALRSYADRLARCRERLEDDAQAARQRIDWARHETRARAALDPDQVRALTDAGIFAPTPGDLEDRRIIARREAQLAAISEVERLTRDAIERQRHPTTRPPERATKDF